MTVIGWDVGGVNTKVARVERGQVVSVQGRPYELQRDPMALVPLLRELAAAAGADARSAHAVTMTAELSQMFRTKREGVAFVLDAFDAAFPDARISVIGVDGRFRTMDDARREPMLVAAANWAATAHAVAAAHPDALLIDMGTTTTDIIPIVNGIVVAEGRTDPDRLATSELVYTGAVRTPVEALVDRVPFRGTLVYMSAEGFALAGDVYVWRGDLADEDYTCPTPDGRPVTRRFAGERLARVVCADRELIDDDGISAIADALAVAQRTRISEAIARIVAQHVGITTAVVTGLGAFIAAAAARAAGLTVVALADDVGEMAARYAPAAAVALVWERAQAQRAGALRQFDGAHEQRAGSIHSARSDAQRSSLVDIVIKIGGSLFALEEELAATVAAIAVAAEEQRVVVVPGGGPFADAVRAADRRYALPDSTAHWMAVLAMDQYAFLLAAKLPRSALVRTIGEITAALNSARVPVLAPSQWLREADPLPHTWDVTSDSIAAWVAGQLAASRLVLVKPANAGRDAVDACFGKTVPPHAHVELTSARHLHLALAVDFTPSGAAGGP